MGRKLTLFDGTSEMQRVCVLVQQGKPFQSVPSKYFETESTTA